MNIIVDEAVAPDDLAINPICDLWCGQRIRPDGDIAKSVPLAGTPRTEICEHPAKFVVGESRIVEVEKEVIDDDLRLTTETRERNQLAVLSCGVHTERAIEVCQRDLIGTPCVSPLAEPRT